MQSSETRALQFSTLSIALSAIIATNSKPLPSPTIALISAGLITIVAFVTIYTVLPQKFHVTGHFWRDWKGHIKDQDSILDILISQAEENDNRVEFNEKILDASAQAFHKCFIAQFWVLMFFTGGQLGASF